MYQQKCIKGLKIAEKCNNKKIVKNVGFHTNCATIRTGQESQGLPYTGFFFFFIFII